MFMFYLPVLTLVGVTGAAVPLSGMVAVAVAPVCAPGGR